MQIQGTPAVGDDGTIYVGSQDNKLYAINSDGTLKWSYYTGGDVSVFGLYLYFLTNNTGPKIFSSALYPLLQLCF